MFGVATNSGLFERRLSRRLSSWTRDHLLKVALAGLGCAVAGAFPAAQLGSGSHVWPAYLALSLIAGLSLTATAVIFSDVINLGLSRAHMARACTIIALPSGTLAVRRGLPRPRASGTCTHHPVAAGHELAAADPHELVRRSGAY